MGNHIFTEDAPGQVRHTASTRPLATDPYLSDAVAIMAKEIWSGATMVTDAIRQFNDSGEPTEAPYTLVNESSVAIWEYLAKQPSRAQRFRGAMKFFGDWSSKLLVSAYPWHQVDRLGAVVVEVGGGHEAVPKALAPATKNVRFVVQYLEDEVAHGGKTLPEDLKGKVEFMHHDIFTEQPVKVADVNFMRWILHDRIDKYAIRILRALAPAMKEVVLSEWLLKDGPETRMTEEYPR